MKTKYWQKDRMKYKTGKCDKCYGKVDQATGYSPDSSGTPQVFMRRLVYMGRRTVNWHLDNGPFQNFWQCLRCNHQVPVRGDIAKRYGKT